MTPPLSQNQIEQIVESTIKRTYADLAKVSPAVFEAMRQLSIVLEANPNMVTSIMTEIAMHVRIREQNLNEEDQASARACIGALGKKDLHLIGGQDASKEEIHSPVFHRVESRGSKGDESNVVIGSNALLAEESATLTTAVGHSSLGEIKDCEGNTAVGAMSMVAATGDYNTAVGAEAMHSTHGDRNTAIGAHALPTIEHAYDNVAVGTHAGAEVTVGSGNTLLGACPGIEGRESLVEGDVNDTIALGSTRSQHAFSAVAFSVLSNDEHKTQMAPLQGGLQAVQHLQPIAYRLETSPNQVRYGFKLEQIQASPHQNALLSRQGKNTFVNESHLVPLLFSAVTELEQRLAAAEKQIEALRAVVSDSQPF